MKAKRFLFISILLILVLSIGAVSAADIDSEIDSDSDISLSSSMDLDVENVESDYVCDENIYTNDSTSSQLLGVGGDEDMLGDGKFTRVEFRDAVDGVITFNKAEGYEPGSERDWDKNGFYYNKIYFLIYDENDEIISLNNYYDPWSGYDFDFDFDFDGNPFIKDHGIAVSDWGESPDGYQYLLLGDIADSVGLDSDDIVGESGTHEFIMYSPDRTISKSVTLNLFTPRKLEADVSIGDVITVDIKTDDEQANFTVYLDDNKVGNGTIDENGEASVSFDKIYGIHALKIVQDGLYSTGLTFEKTLYIPEGLPGSFVDLNNIISENGVVNLSYDFAFDPAEYELFKDGIKIDKDLTINGNNHVINGSNIVRVFNIDNNANVVLKDLIITGAYYSSSNGGAVLLKSGTLTIENCTFVDNVLFDEETGWDRRVYGGAIYASDRTTLNINNSLFKHNLNDASEGSSWLGTNEFGGAIGCADNVNLNVLNTVFIDNKADSKNEVGRYGRGGAIHSTGSNSNNNIINCTFINNTASEGVGAIQTRNANIIGCIFINNTANNDWPAIYYEGGGKGTISYNVFLDNNTQIRLINNYKNVVEEYNWWATNEPADMIRLQDTLSIPNKYIMLEAYNGGKTVYAGFIRDSTQAGIPNINTLPLRKITFEGDVNETELELINGIVAVEYTSPITDGSQIKATVDGYTIDYNLSAGTIQSIDTFIDNTTVGNNGSIIIYLLGDNGVVEGTLNVYLNDTLFEVPVENGIATLNAGSDMDGGIYDIYYQYLGSENYAPVLNNIKSDSKFKIDKRDVEITYSINPDNGYITYNVVDDEFKPTGSLTCVIDDDWTRTWSSISGTTNTFNMDNGTHNISLTYNGDAKHNPKTLNGSFEVIKYMPPCTITQDGGKFTFDFTSELSWGGRVTVNFVGPNSFSRDLGNLPRDGVVSVDVTNDLINGKYNLTAHLDSSKFKYSSADFNYTFDIYKRDISSMTISPEAPTKTVNTVIPVTVTIKVNDGDPIPTGKVSFDQSGSESSGTLDENGVATITWRNYNERTGVQVKNVTYSGDINYKPFSIEVTFTCTPTALDVNLALNGHNATLTFNDRWGGDNNGVVHIYDYDTYLGNVTGDNGFPEFKVDNLDSGVHYFKVIWVNNNGNNYTSGKSVVLDRVPGVSQWGSTGNDIKNSGYSNYTRPIDDVFVLWSNNESIDLNKYPNYYRTEYNGQITEIVHGGATTYSPLITSDGLIYLNDGYYVYVYDKEGNVLYTKAPGRRITGIALYNDTMSITPRADDEVRIYDLFKDKSYHGEFQWVSSSLYYPVVGPDGRVYISGMFNNMANNGNWVTVIKYEERSINYGNTQKFNWNEAYVESKPISSVVFDDDGNMWVATVNGIRAVNIYTDAKVFSDSSISINARPVISAANIVYYLSTETENSLYALTAEGYLWNTTVTGTIGTTLAVDNENGFVYSVNKEGALYKYDENDGTETFVYDIGAEGVSIIVDGDGNVYVADKVGFVTAVDSEGNLLWTINLGSRIAGGMAMDKNGIIYAYTNNTLFALGYRNPISIEVTVPEGEFTTMDNVTITATLNETTEGNVTFTVGELSETVPVDGNTASWTTKLPAGNQTITATFEGNEEFATAEDSIDVEIVKVTPELNVNIKNGTVFENASITVTSNNCKGNVTVKVGDETYEDVVIGEELILPILPIDVYDVTVTYNEDEIYTEAVNDTEKLEITKADAIIIPDVVADAEKSTITLDLPDDATGYVLADVNGTGYYAPVKDGKAVISIPNLEPGNYTAEITYLGDDNYNNASFEVPLNIPEEPVIEPKDPELKATADNTTITVTVNKDATGGVVVDIDGTSYYAEIKDGQAVIDVKGLEAGKDYTATVTYVGDDNFTEDETTVEISVPAEEIVEPKDPELKATAENTTVTVTVNKDATGGVIVDVDGTSYYAEIKDGQAIIDVKGLESGKDYTATVIYTGDENFTEDETTVKISVPKEEEPVEPEPEEANMTTTPSDSTISVELPKDATGYVLVDVDGKGYYAKVTDGKATVDVAGLDAGNYTATVTYTGDDKYAPATNNVTLSIPEEEPAQNETNETEPVTPEMTVKVTNTTIEVTLPKDATGNVLVDVNGQGYYAPVKDGKATVNVIGLDEGTYTATVTYTGDDKYTNATKSDSVTVPKEEEPAQNETEPVDPKADINVSDDAVNVELPKDATGYVLVDVDGKGYYAPVKDGKATVELPELAAGNHTVTVTYTGDDKYKAANATKTVEVPEDVPEITVMTEDLTKIEKGTGSFVANFTDAEGKALANTKVTFEINGGTYTRTTNANGQASFAVNLVPGTYTIKTTNPETKESATNTITVLPRFTEDSDLVKYFRNDSQYVLKVLDDDGNPAKAGEIVTYNINGVFYNRTTNATGHVKLNINLPPDTYIITAEYKGCKVAHNVKVLPTLTGNDITKKYGQAGAYEAKLVDGQGKVYANQKIEFNINGVMYQRTTNADGVAKLNINLQAGKYIITASYGQARISNTVTVTA